MKSTIPDEPVLESIVLCLMNHYIKRIPIDRNHIDVKLYGVNDQIELTDGKYVKYKICSQLELCLYDEEDDNDYFNLYPRKKSSKTFFYQITHSLMECIQFEFSDGSMEEIKVPLVAQKIYYDVTNDLHLTLAEAYNYSEKQSNDLVNKKAVSINYN